jgi:hypothetical protein
MTFEGRQGRKLLASPLRHFLPEFICSDGATRLDILLRLLERCDQIAIFIAPECIDPLPALITSSRAESRRGEGRRLPRR